jgi:NitT/TauT family transport system substrate-binding protein
MKKLILKMCAGVCATAISLSTFAMEKVSVAIGQKGLWDTMVTLQGIEQGFFKKEGLDVSVTWTKGGSATLQAVMTGSTQYALANGTLGVLGAYGKGAPIRIVMAQMTGAPDLYWYVKNGSSVKSMKDTEGKTFGFSRPGSSTHLVGLALADQAGVSPKMTPSGGISGTRTQVMSDQIDVGWSVPPFNLDMVAKGDIRIIARGSDVASLNGQTIRVNVVNAEYMKANPESVKKFVRAYKNTIDWMYSNTDASVAFYAKFNKIDESVARESLKFYPKSSLGLSVAGIDESMAQAVKNKNLDAPLSKAQLAELIQTP